MRKLSQAYRMGRACKVGSIVSAAMLAVVASAEAGSLETLHAFATCAGDACSDGSSPYGNLVGDPAGNFYGTTALGGAHGGGTIFELSPNGEGGWKHRTLYSFCSEDNCADGKWPQATLIIDSEGSLYGTTLSGGEDEGGGVGFKFDRGSAIPELVVIHNFCGADSAEEDDCKGGSTPSGGFTYAGAVTGLPYDGQSALYGSSLEGGEGEAGIIYQLTPRTDGARGKDKEEWRVKELYVFCAPAGAMRRGAAKMPEGDGNCDDGKGPSGNLLVDARGRLYGTTYYGGEDKNFPNGGGVIFQLVRDRADKAWAETVLYKFCSLANCRDGRAPYGGLIRDAAGNFFGAAEAGGRNCNAGQINCGVVFMVSPNGENSVSRVLHAFCTADKCADGATPEGALVMDSSGNLFGATLNGGVDKGGVVYRLRPDGKLQVLHSFCAAKSCTGSGYPSGVVMDGSGELLGVAAIGGKKGGGEVFRVVRGSGRQ